MTQWVTTSRNFQSRHVLRIARVLFILLTRENNGRQTKTLKVVEKSADGSAAWLFTLDYSTGLPESKTDRVPFLQAVDVSGKSSSLFNSLFIIAKGALARTSPFSIWRDVVEYHRFLNECYMPVGSSSVSSKPKNLFSNSMALYGATLCWLLLASWLSRSNWRLFPSVSHLSSEQNELVAKFRRADADYYSNNNKSKFENQQLESRSRMCSIAQTLNCLDSF